MPTTAPEFTLTYHRTLIDSPATTAFKMGFLGKSKKAKDADYYLPDDGGEATVSKMSRSLKRKAKHAVVPKPEIDLATALPATNNFRISLMMPELSARFSMLREQDDPTTKVGKANDDSVLFPKRASRLNLFAHNPLTDIAEVESIHTSTTIRPPFAQADRPYSLSDGYASDDGGVMNRSKPGEGNNLFGGRQKMYRVPAAGGSVRTLPDGLPKASAMGKHVYEDDVSTSLFQKDQAQSREGDRWESSTLDDQEEADAVSSPLTAFSKNRGTTSSTTSGPSNRRTSTAATSITSESPVPRQNSYGFASKQRTSDSVNGSDESLVKRNPSSDSRKNFALRDGAPQPPVPSLNKSLSQSRSAVNLTEKYFRPGLFSSSAFRAVSPPPSSNPQAIASLDLGLQEANQRVASPVRRYQTSSPSSPSPIEDEVDHVYSSLQPNDRGKATAMGLFNRPQQQFDEQQFLQRQRQMLEGRSSPFPSEPRSESRASPEITSSAMRRIDAALSNDIEMSTTQPPLNPNSASAASSPQPKGLRNFSSPHKNDITGSRPRIPSSTSSRAGPDVKAKVESLIRRENAELAALEAERSALNGAPGARKISLTSESPTQFSRGTFFNNFDASEDEADQSPQRESRPRIAPADIHPALRDGTHDFDFGDNISITPRIPYRGSNASNASTSRPVNDTIPARDTLRQPSQPKGGDSPTLGPNGLGLSGMIRSHLRHDSDRSSVYPPSPGVSNFSHREVSMASTTHTINPPESVHSDPWEFDSASRNQKSSQLEARDADSAPTLSQKAKQILGHAQRQPGTSKAQQVLGREAPNGSSESVNARPWQEEMVSHHRRAESTETQKERQDFDDELAERRRRVDERLKGNAEQELRTRSPFGRQERQNLPAQAFHTVKNATSLGSMGPPGRPDGQPKAMKMLGIGSREDISWRSPHLGRDHEFDQYHEGLPPASQYRQRPPPAVDPGYRNGRRTPAEGRAPMEPYANGRRTPAEGRAPYANGSYEDFERQRQRSATPNSGRPHLRDRAMSEAAERSRSRTGQYRDEYGYPPPMQERHGQSRSPPDAHNRRGAPTPDLYERSPSAMSVRQRNGSRPPQPGYFDSRSAPPAGPMGPPMSIPPGGGVPRPSPRPPVPNSPMSPFKAPGAPFGGPPSNTPSAAESAMPSPVANSYPNSDNRFPPGNGTSRPNRDRKKSVTRGMISEPTFVSSTSSVPLVDLPGGSPSPRPNPIASPPVPAMNPRRRGNTVNDDAGSGSYGSHSAQPSPSMPMHSPLSTMHESGHAHPSQYSSQQDFAAYQGGVGQKPPPRARNRLRKISSEGGNMASRARQQAFMNEMGREKENSPRVPMFPNRSATSLGMAERDGGMF